MATKDRVTVYFAVADNLDPAPRVTAMLLQVEDRGSPRGARPAAIAVVNGQQIEPLDIDDGMWRLTVGATDFADNASFASGGLFEVMHDVLPPRTALSTTGNKYQGAGPGLYVTGMTAFTLTSVDDLVAVLDGIGLGVKKQNLGVRAEGIGLLRESLFENTNPAQGATFASTFRLDREADGLYGLSYNSEDVLGNLEKVIISTFIVDNTAPQTAFNRVLGPAYLNYVSTWTLFELAPVDPGAFASGVKETSHNVNSGAVSTSLVTFTLPGADGNYLIKYRSSDNVENLEVERSSSVFVDAAPPFTALAAIGGNQYPGFEPGSFYVSLASKFSFVAVDPVSGGGAAGVKSIEYADNGSISAVYAQPISLDEGKHIISYRAADRVENIEVFRSTQVYVDNTAPTTVFNIYGPLYIKDGVRYITQASGLTFTSTDPVIKEVSAGVARMETAVDGGQWLKYTQPLKFAEGRHTIKYRAIDNVGNTEAEKTLEVQSDNTPPLSGWLVNSGDWAELAGNFYLNALGRIALESVDPVTAGVASGVEGIYYGINSAPANNYAAPFGLAEGIRTIKFSAKDNVDNTEVAKSTVIYVDGRKPVTELSLSGDQYKGDKQYVSQRTDILLTASDPVVNNAASGVKETKYSIDGGTYIIYSLFKLNTEGRRVVSFYSADHVNNVEAVKTSELWVDTTPPVTGLTVSGPRYAVSGDEISYITKDSLLALPAVDLLSNDTASGVLLTKYRINGGNWQVYTGSITITTEGLHTLEYYSLDRVQNAEVLKTAKIAVDNTPPVSRLITGRPRYELPGYTLVSTKTILTLEAADPLSGGVASGLSGIYYSITAVAGPTPVVPYFTPFT
ncbi:MAG: hypothetical protein Q8O90_13070, partial [Elusimicrobiota bacterium]|nr:hypothetical protein [Elusimicrobiota bacterium]